MEIAFKVPFASPRITERFVDACAIFIQTANDSAAANMVIHLLVHAESDRPYAIGGRNDAVRRLASAVEETLGMKANMLFRTPGPLHDALQTLMDAYEDAMDGIYYLEN